MKKLKILLTFFKPFFKLFITLLIRVFLLLIIFSAFNYAGCKKEDIGKCTIKTHAGDDQVFDDISLEECQVIFGNTVGGYGWEWEPKN